MTRPPEAHPLAHVLALHSTGPTDPRFSTLLVGAVLTTGRRTVANVLRTLRHLAPGHPADDRRVLSRAPWSGVAVGCAPTRFLLDRVVPDGPVTLVGDDTVGGHPGRTVYGKGRHRDAVRSSHAYTAWRYGHTWVVLAVLVDRYRTPEVRTAEGARHRTPARLVCRLLRLVLLRFPDRAVVLAGDSGFGTHEVARFGHRHRGRPTLVSKLPPDADVFAPPPAYAGHGRPRVKGARVPKPRPAAATARRARRAVTWYGGAGRGGSRRRPGPGSGTRAGAGWSRSGGRASRTPPAPTGASTGSPPTSR